MVFHTISPVYNENSEILILGSFPSVKSREQGFFYGHPQNRFWRVLAGVFNTTIPKTIDEKRDFLLKNHVAVWDVIYCCEIVGSADNTITNVIPNDISKLLKTTKIKRIFVNGKTAQSCYNKYLKNKLNINAEYLPSTSPANASYSLFRLISAWNIIK